MLKKRLEKTQRELDAMKTIRMHSMPKEEKAEELHKKNKNKVRVRVRFRVRVSVRVRVCDSNRRTRSNRSV